MIHDDYLDAFETAQHQLTVPSPQLWRYLAGLHAWLGGSHEFHRGAGRYTTNRADTAVALRATAYPLAGS